VIRYFVLLLAGVAHEKVGIDIRQNMEFDLSPATQPRVRLVLNERRRARIDLRRDVLKLKGNHIYYTVIQADFLPNTKES